MTSRLRRLLVPFMIAVLVPLLVPVAGAAATEPSPDPAPDPAAALSPSPADPDQPISDQRLIEAMETSTNVAVEVLTTEVDAVAATVDDLGGVVTGTVEGEVVQAVVPSEAVDDLAVADGVAFVQSPRLVGRPPSMPRPEVGPGLGPVVGQNVAVTNAAAWQAAGIDGSVRVGILDYFDIGLWNPAEAGPAPDGAHRFCLDTSGPPAGSPDNLCHPSHDNGLNDDDYSHGVAVAQVLKDIAPGAEVFLATAGTISDMNAAVDWFIANGVHIVTRSLGAAYDGPGDGTGPLATVVDRAVSGGITWFNSGGNDAIDGYARIPVPNNLAATGGYIDFDNGPGVDTYLRISAPYVLLDGIRWSDWYRGPSERTDYTVEVWSPTSNPDFSNPENYNPPPDQLVPIGGIDANQAAGAPPLEGADELIVPPNNFGFASGIVYLRIHRKDGTPVVGDPDVLEVAIGFGFMERSRSQAAYSAAKPVVDSRNPAVVAVGAIDPADGSGPDAIAYYSSQGPTNDGRIKPDVAAPSCVTNQLYAPGCFNGTSAASPTVAGLAALLLDAGVALPGAPLADAVRHFTFDRAFAPGGPADGPDNKYGIGQVRLPNPPGTPPGQTRSVYHALTPVRILDTRPSSAIGQPELIGTHRTRDILDVTVAGVGGVPADATAVALNITTDQAGGVGFIQAVPYLWSPLGASSTLNVASAGATQPNFAVVPVGSEGKIAIYTVPGGHLIVDVLGYFSASSPTAATGRFVSIDPVRTLDTRTAHLVPAGWSPHKPGNETVVVPAASSVPASGVAALVLHVTSTEADAPGFLRAQPNGTTPPSSTVNYTTATDTANTVIVPLGADGRVSVYTNAASHIVVDVTGYITDSTAASSAVGLFVPLATVRVHDSREPPNSFLPPGSVRSVQLANLSLPSGSIPPSISAISINLTAVGGAGPGFLSAFPAGTARPETSSLNYVASDAIANGALLKLSNGGALDFFANQRTDFVIDVNGYFT